MIWGEFMRAAIRLTFINNEKKFMGPGTRELLGNIQSFSSIKAASNAMDMSYSKALHMLRTMEAELGFPVVLSERGGIDRGSTTLTQDGERVLRTFQEIETAVLSYAQALVDEKF